MSEEVMMALIALVSGGGLTTVIKLLIDNVKSKKEVAQQEIDDRIAAWQRISEKNEERLAMLERKTEIYDRDFIKLERYIVALEQTLLKNVPDTPLPERPVLEREIISA
ncbi:MAG: hypothetical protein LBS74_09420 [Oscillospiraceae bacterium]|jgi:hypothetical protein|nr:hypothetical protein [Oscillospiraceae bacterium]